MRNFHKIIQIFLVKFVIILSFWTFTTFVTLAEMGFHSHLCEERQHESVTSVYSLNQAVSSYFLVSVNVCM